MKAAKNVVSHQDNCTYHRAIQVQLETLKLWFIIELLKAAIACYANLQCWRMHMKSLKPKGQSLIVSVGVTSGAGESQFKTISIFLPNL